MSTPVRHPKNGPPPQFQGPVAYVYLPDDEEDTFIFNGTQFWLVPNAITVIGIPEDGADHWKGVSAAEIANHAQAQLTKYGIRRVPEEVVAFLSPESSPAEQALGKAQFQEIQKEAEAAYIQGTKEWATNLRLEHLKKAKVQAEVGLRYEPTSQELAADAWLVKYGFLSE